MKVLEKELAKKNEELDEMDINLQMSFYKRKEEKEAKRDTQ